jgi:hypothetical protein
MQLDKVKTSDLIDELGEIRSEITTAKSEEAALIKEITRRGLTDGTEIRGEYYGARAVVTEPYANVAWKQVAIAMQPTPALVERFTEISPPQIRVRTFAIRKEESCE